MAQIFGDFIEQFPTDHDSLELTFAPDSRPIKQRWRNNRLSAHFLASIISEEWERKINLLKRRVQRLHQKISNPQSEETRLDDYVMELNRWLRERFKEPRQKWQEPQVLVKGIENIQGITYVQFNLNFFVDDIRLENGRRGDRISSQIYEEVVQYLKNSATQVIEKQASSNTNITVQSDNL
ncbi:MAG: hypothetical protein PUP92_24340 [Rhizonema sp. PD38]|nr:hypothetical protein [Rhizonema sp. PD38]